MTVLIGPVTAATMTTLNCQDLLGSDYNTIQVVTPEECSNACLNDAQCLAATFVHANGQTPTCWLKNAVPTATPAQCDFQLTIHSFIKQTAFPKKVAACFNSNPHAQFGTVPSQSGLVPLTIHFTDQSTGAKSWNWDFGDGSTSTDQSPDHSYAAGTMAGTSYTVTLTITGSCPGESDSSSLTVRAFDNVGLFSINSDPSGAKITFDHIPVSKTTPFLADGWVPVGLHGIILKLDGYDDYATTFMVEKGQTAQVNAVLVKNSSSPPNPTSTTGWLKITTVPAGAAVFLDDSSQGTTPTTIPGLSPGSYSLRLTKSGYTDYKAPVTINAGLTTPLNINLVAGTGPTSTTPTPIPNPGTTGSIAVISAPSGASVSLDGQDQGITPVTIPNVKAGSHTVILYKSGYDDYPATVTVKAGSTSQITISLTGQTTDPTPSAPATLTIRSTPVGANVYIDGETAGITPVKIQNVKTGTRKLLLTLKGYSDNSQTIDITSGSDKELSVVFGKPATEFALPVSLAALAFTALVVMGRKKDR